jgi:hypothetical protein
MTASLATLAFDGGTNSLAFTGTNGTGILIFGAIGGLGLILGMLLLLLAPRRRGKGSHRVA